MEHGHGGALKPPAIAALLPSTPSFAASARARNATCICTSRPGQPGSPLSYAPLADAAARPPAPHARPSTRPSAGCPRGAHCRGHGTRETGQGPHPRPSPLIAAPPPSTIAEPWRRNLETSQPARTTSGAHRTVLGAALQRCSPAERSLARPGKCPMFALNCLCGYIDSKLALCLTRLHASNKTPTPSPGPIAAYATATSRRRRSSAGPDLSPRFGAIHGRKLAMLNAVPLARCQTCSVCCSVGLGIQILKRDTRPFMFAFAPALWLAVFEKLHAPETVCVAHAVNATVPVCDLDMGPGPAICNIPSEAFAVGCGDTLGPRWPGWLTDKGNSSGTELPSTLSQQHLHPMVPLV
ncbi:hypothetical protein FB567DRAFT_553515 [Paraphoma chrysanthemicola]|uniref:Uncharacterized protein n=1 Tax=Paraphoma chrysanthemicola TaxID=798071 RepID=A0A8K0QXH6_9PLEO|nr:hypothetical protein FB567DRAFT_553515 [Paraphoma chrysanthemicola]